jgi:hypothetical protein
VPTYICSTPLSPSRETGEVDEDDCLYVDVREQGEEVALLARGPQVRPQRSVATVDEAQYVAEDIGGGSHGAFGNQEQDLSDIGGSVAWSGGEIGDGRGGGYIWNGSMSAVGKGCIITEKGMSWEELEVQLMVSLHLCLFPSSCSDPPFSDESAARSRRV